MLSMRWTPIFIASNHSSRGKVPFEAQNTATRESQMLAEGLEEASNLDFDYRLENLPKYH